MSVSIFVENNMVKLTILLNGNNTSDTDQTTEEGAEDSHDENAEPDWQLRELASVPSL
jgi:hypothetical protein